MKELPIFYRFSFADLVFIFYLFTFNFYLFYRGGKILTISSFGKVKIKILSLQGKILPYGDYQRLLVIFGIRLVNY